MEKNSPSWRATKSSFVGRLANFGNVSLFSSRGNKHVFRAYPSTLKIAKLCFETTALASCTFYNYLKCSARLSPSSRSRNRLCQCTATSTHLWSSRKHDIAHRNNAQDCFAITGYSVHHKIRSQVPIITRAILLRNQSPGVSNFQRGQSCEEIFDTSRTFLNPLVRMNLLYGKWTVGFFSLASQAGALCPHEALMLLLLYSKPILRKNQLFCSLLLPVYMHFLFCLFYSHSSFIYLFIYLFLFFFFNWSFATVNQSGDGRWKYVELTLRFH